LVPGVSEDCSDFRQFQALLGPQDLDIKDVKAHFFIGF
jgi:hypothetical protein